MESDHEAIPPKGVSDRLKIHAARVKQHLQENKTTYLVGAGCLAAGYFLRSSTARTVIVNEVKPVIAPVMHNVVHNTVNNGGHMRKIVRCLETDEMWPSVKAAAETVGKSVVVMSKHLNGHTDHIEGLHYVIEGLAAG